MLEVSAVSFCSMLWTGSYSHCLLSAHNQLGRFWAFASIWYLRFVSSGVSHHTYPPCDPCTPLVSLAGLYAISSDVRLNLSGMNVRICHDPNRQSACYDRVCSRCEYLFPCKNSFEVRLSVLLSTQWAKEMAIGSSGGVLAESLIFPIYVCYTGAASFSNQCNLRTS